MATKFLLEYEDLKFIIVIWNDDKKWCQKSCLKNEPDIFSDVIYEFGSVF